MIAIKFMGELEVDVARGVLYFHDHSSGRTVLRICRLPRFKLMGIATDPTSSIDITTGVGMSMSADMSEADPVAMRAEALEIVKSLIEQQNELMEKFQITAGEAHGMSY